MTSAADDAWPELTEMIGAAPSARILDGGSIEDLARLGLTERSYLGALVRHTGGVVIDDGWLRLLGGAGGQLPSLVDVNARSSGLCVVGFDVLGGVFALDGGAFGSGDGSVHYFAPDSLEWEALDVSHSRFVTAMLTDAIGKFAESLRWDGWRDETSALALDHGVSLYPPLSTAEGKDPSASSRRPVHMSELVGDFWPGVTTGHDRNC
ncbi:DUF2625 family protein [Curtobacterium sp. 'Ferrero']|uniref:DUF2625 family protein n=1 Tax=Curtobacterium sp. 'Ferrero' TaxID=2033654 RepID=UPI001142CD37|nr:DUF2625 family protein [Curtobacterium sp. 'Ferrero']